MIQGAIIFVIGILLLYAGINAYRKSKHLTGANIFTDELVERVLQSSVEFYDKLNREESISFKERVIRFLQQIQITPVNKVVLATEDKILIAAAGIIPIFRYQNWFYNNLDEVLVYPEPFDKDFAQSGSGRDVIGMVGDGAMHRTMILSLPYLRAGFAKGSASNTAIHEFAHLVDKSDGAVDGIPEMILQDDNIKPWVTAMHQYIKVMRAGKTDIDPYGATNEAEFFAVMSEYFFQKPEKLKEKHPDLYKILDEAFEKSKSQ